MASYMAFFASGDGPCGFSFELNLMGPAALSRKISSLELGKISRAKDSRAAANAPTASAECLIN